MVSLLCAHMLEWADVMSNMAPGLLVQHYIPTDPVNEARVICFGLLQPSGIAHDHDEEPFLDSEVARAGLAKLSVPWVSCSSARYSIGQT